MRNVLGFKKKHFEPTTSGFAERYTFYHASKSSTETINKWTVRERELAVNCEYGIELATTIRDKFVMGLEKGPARDKIFLGTVECSLDKVLEIANSTEYIKHQYETVTVKEENFNLIRKTNSKREKVDFQNNDQKQRFRKCDQQCEVFGYKNHKGERCKFKNYKCNIKKSKEKNVTV